MDGRFVHIFDQCSTAPFSVKVSGGTLQLYLPGPQRAGNRLARAGHQMMAEISGSYFRLRVYGNITITIIISMS